MVKSLSFSGSKKKVHNTPDNLKSDDNGEMVLGLCEGPIKGLEDGGHSLFLDDSPLWDENGVDVYESYYLRITEGDGTQDESIQLKLGGLGNACRSDGKSLIDTGDFSEARTTSANIDFIDVRINISQLVYQHKSGSTSNSTGRFKIEYRRNDESSFKLYQDCAVTGKTTSSYVKDYRIEIERNPQAGLYYVVRVTRISPKSTTDVRGTLFEFNFPNIEEIDASKQEFKDTAIMHFTLKTTDNVTQLPTLRGIFKLLKIKIPSNYDPETHTYNGIWDGSFKIAWSDNPAWCLYDLIMNARYGVNAYYPVEADKWDFYNAGRYCDELVDDGCGGLEPRYTFNYVITDSQSGPDMLNFIAATFNAVIYEDASGLVRLAYEDNLKAPVAMFNPTNITEDGFSYSFTEPESQYNDYTVTFINPDLEWNEDRRRVITPYGADHIEEWGRIPFEYNATGCIKESEAIRKTRFKLITSMKETMTVTFTTNRFATAINLFDTILVSDPDMNWTSANYGAGVGEKFINTGRIKGIDDSRTIIYFRDPIYLEGGDTHYEIKIQTAYDVLTFPIIMNKVGIVKEVKIDGRIPQFDDEYSAAHGTNEFVYEKAVFSIYGTDQYGGSPKAFRVVAISESEGNPDKISITATEIHRLKQQEADTGIQLEDVDASTRPNYSDIPHILDANFKEYFDENRLENALQIGIVLDWDAYPYYTGRFEVYSRLKTEDNSDVWTLRDVTDGDTIYGHPAGLYEFKILPLTVLGMKPSLETAPIFEFNVSEIALEPPAQVENFKATGNVENIYLKWDKVENASGYEIRIGEDWDTAKVIADGIQDTQFYYTAAEAGNVYKFLIKAINVGGQYSEYASVDYGALQPPKDVKRFYVTPNLDNLRFDWVVEPENYVSYEVRVGAAWESGITLFTTDYNNQTILDPGQGVDTWYFIKAISKKGIYSENAIFARLKQNLKQNRNVIKEWDNVADNWKGISHGLSNYDSQEIKVMSDGYFNSEHFWHIGFNEVTISRNWYENEFFKFGDRLRWMDLTFPWDSEEARYTSWLNEQDALDYGGVLRRWIATRKEEEYTNTLGLKFNGTTDTMTGEKPLAEKAVKYDAGRTDKGLVISKILNLKYDVKNLKETFSTRFRVHLNAEVPSDPIRVFRLEGDEIWIDCWIENNEIYAKRSDGKECRGEFKFRKYLDWMSVMITQEENKFRLDYYVEYANIKNSIDVEAKPLGVFNILHIGYRNE